jgi:hypothetical protein
MRGDIPPLLQYAFMACFPVKKTTGIHARNSVYNSTSCYNETDVHVRNSVYNPVSCDNVTCIHARNSVYNHINYDNVTCTRP